LREQVNLALEVPDKERSLFQRRILDLSRKRSTFFAMENIGEMFLAPPLTPDGEWRKLAEAFRDEDMRNVPNPTGKEFLEVLRAWHEGNPQAFNAAVARYHGTINPQAVPSISKVRFEQLFNHVAPFVKAMALYILALVLALISWLSVAPADQESDEDDSRGRISLANRKHVRGDLGRQCAMAVIGVAFVVHTLGLTARIYMQGRPPVTNLYSSAVFVAWGCIVLGMVIEYIYRNGIGAVTAAMTGFLSLLVAHNLAGDGDTMTMMQAVLDTNFWLATHVVVITLGYAATFLAGFLAIIYILRGALTRSLSERDAKALARMVYGIICFATLFSFVGTILGGIWADQSWGRFWGWDPKENGALMIVLWNALVLHARWGGLARARGIAVLAVFGNIVTAWSWFGTNMLGVGLHAYGFIDSALMWMGVFIFSQLAIMAIGCIPTANWRSFSGMQKPRRNKSRDTAITGTV